MKSATVEITSRCSNSCIHCSNGRQRIPFKDISFLKLLDIIIDLKKNGFEEIIFSGGDPFLYPNFDKILFFTKACGLYVSVYCIGNLYNVPRMMMIGAVQKFTKKTFKVFKKYIDRMIFSLHGTLGHIHDEITQAPGSYERLFFMMNNVKKTKIKMDIHIVPMTLNIDYFKNYDHLQQIKKKYKINEIRFIRLLPHGRAKESWGGENEI